MPVQSWLIDMGLLAAALPYPGLVGGRTPARVEPESTTDL